jgi:hypothetical protein
MRASDRLSRVPILLALLTLLSTPVGVSSANAQSSPYGDLAVSFASVDNLQPSGFRFLITLENEGGLTVRWLTKDFAKHEKRIP